MMFLRLEGCQYPVPRYLGASVLQNQRLVSVVEDDEDVVALRAEAAVGELGFEHGVEARALRRARAGHRTGRRCRRGALSSCSSSSGSSARSSSLTDSWPVRPISRVISRCMLSASAGSFRRLRCFISMHRREEKRNLVATGRQRSGHPVESRASPLQRRVGARPATRAQRHAEPRSAFFPNAREQETTIGLVSWVGDHRADSLLRGPRLSLRPLRARRAARPLARANLLASGTR